MDDSQKPTPDRPTTQDRQAFLLPVPRARLIHLLRRASQEDGFTGDEARLSLLLDVDDGRWPSRQSCADSWGWSYKKVRYHWDEIWRDVAEECASYGRQMDSPLVGRLPVEWQRYLAQKYGVGAADRPLEGQKKGNPRATKTAKMAPKTTIRGKRRAKEGQPGEADSAPGAIQGQSKGNPRATKTAKTDPKTQVRGNAGAKEGQKKGNDASHNARARHPLPLPKDLSNAAAATTTVDSSDEAPGEEAAAAAILDLESDTIESRTADAEILSFCQSIGLSEAVAGRLASHPDAAYVRAQVASYQAAKGKGPGWFVRAVDEGYDLRAEATGAPARSRRKPETGQAASAPNPIPARPLLDNLDDL